MPLFIGMAVMVFSVTGIVFLMTSKADAQQNDSRSEWMQRDYHYIIVKQDVRDVLNEFGRNLSLPVEISRDVRGEVRGEIQAGNAREFLEQVCAANDLAWFFDGGVLHITSRRELTQRTFDLSRVDVDRLMEDIGQAGAGEPMQARLVDADSALQVWGVDAWIESVARHVERLRNPMPGGRGEVQVFRGSVAPTTAE
ncbi:hypothetical protein AR456_17235 [Halomonas huangheensis]|nr:hypothetical protein AR456_17235 [Halomonas huangheensis]